MQIVFWGTRGTVPSSSDPNSRFGCRTACVEVRAGDDAPIVIDGGTGLVAFGENERRTQNPAQGAVNLFLSHFHWDHIHGLPIYLSSAVENSRVVIHGPPGVEEAVQGQMAAPYCPVPFSKVPAEVGVSTLEHPIEIEHCLVAPFPVHHPQGCSGYEVRHEDSRLVYATDTEPDGGALDEVLAEKAKGADVLIMDATNTLEEVPARRGWGHSTWEDCVRVAGGAGVRQLVLFHHDPFHDDGQIEEIERQARQVFPATLCARDRLRLDLT